MSATPSPPAQQSAAPREISTGRAWWTLAVLFIAYVFSFIDRNIVSLLVEPLKRDLDLSDTQISLLQGFAFVLVYTVGGIPIATLADRGSRRKIVAIGIFVWSGMTALCGFASSYGHLFLARMGVGIGEASLSPCTFSLLADAFPESKRGRAMAIYSAGTNIGMGVALLIGGAVIGLAADAGSISTSFGELRSWQLVFIVVGLPGFAIAALALTMADPRRTIRGAAALASPPLLPFLRAHPLAITGMFVGFSLFALIAAALMAWAPSFYIRVHGYSPATIGARLGVIYAVAGLAGAYAGGAWADRWTRRGMADAPMRTAAIGAAASTVVGPLAMIASTPASSLALITLAIFFTGIGYPCGAASLQKLSPPMLRARMAALYLVAVGLISGLIGPTSVALLTDHVFGDPKRIGTSLAVVMFASGIVAVIGLTGSLGAYRRSVAPSNI